MFFDYESVARTSGQVSSWVEAYYRPFGTSGCGESGRQLFKFETNAPTWHAESFSVTGPGQIYFNVRQQGNNAITSLYVDDVSIG